jgi:phospholipid-binding lipoprotein MlaA
MSTYSRAIAYVAAILWLLAHWSAQAAGRDDFVPMFRAAQQQAVYSVPVDNRTTMQQGYLARLRGQQLIALFTSTAVDAISQYPGRVGDIMAAAAAVAPDAMPSVASSVASTYPGFAAEIARATGQTSVAAQAAGAGWASSRSTPSYYTTAPASPAVAPAPPSAARQASNVLPWALSSIAARPDMLTAIVAQAVAAAPAARDEIVASLSQTFPGFAAQIAAAAHQPVVPAAARVLAPAPANPQSALPARQNPSPPAKQSMATPQPPATTAQPATVPAAAPAAEPPKAPVLAQKARPPSAPKRLNKAKAADDLSVFDEQAEVYDPIEPFNRVMFSLNDTIDFVLFRPIAWTYNKIMPDPAILAIRRFFLNLQAPVIFANDLLQADFNDAMVTAGRFGINTTIGILGLFDFAEDFGLKRHHADFGQTLHSYGTGPGPYLVIPIIGPSNTRDAVGLVGDYLLNPLTWLLEPKQQLIVTISNGVVKREELLVPLDELREASVDYYTALKSAWNQNRKAQLAKDPSTFKSGMDAQQYNNLFDNTK